MTCASASGLGLGYWFEFVIIPSGLVALGAFLTWYLTPPTHRMVGYGALVALHEHHRLESPMGELKVPVREGSVSAGVSSPAPASRGEASKNQ